MLTFQKKVAVLKNCESIVYTICLSILTDEHSACEMAKRVLIELFKDSEFWMREEKDRQAYISRLCMRRCFPPSMHTHAAAASSCVS